MPNKNTEACRHFELCGGCTHQDMDYAAELSMKEAAVHALLQPFLPPDDQVFEGIRPAPSVTAYRNKMEFAFGDEERDGRLALGIRKRRSFYEVVTPEYCGIIPNDFKKILLTVLAYFRETNESFYHRRRHTGALRYLILRRGEFTGEVLVNLVTTSCLHASLEPLTEQITRLPLTGRVVGVLHTVNDGVADTVKNESVHVLAGRDYFFEKLCGLTFKVSAFSFFQTNSAGAEVLYQAVADYAGHGGLIYDLYCGTGTIGQLVAKNAQAVLGMELSEEAVRAAADNALLNEIQNCTFVAGDVTTQAGGLVEKYGKPDVLIVDPPRDGLHPKALPKIIDMQAERFAYVSCKPASLARDMAVLTQNGYRLVKAVCVDMFPRTPHVETVALMTKAAD